MQISDERFILGIMIKIIDAHCHIQSTQDIAHMLSRADDMGVVGAICNATSPRDWDNVIKICNKYDNIYGCVGVHPWHIATVAGDDTWVAHMCELLHQTPNLMVGEIGLDKNYPDLDAQERIFIAQLNIAYEYNRPAFIHCVGAWNRILYILKKQKSRLPKIMVAHAFSGPTDIIERLISQYNFYFSYSPMITDARHRRAIDAVHHTPDCRILVESDAPDISGAANVLHHIANIKSVAVDKIADTIYKNIIMVLNNG